MIPPSPVRLETEPWQHDIARAITDPAELLRILGLDQRDLPPLRATGHGFGLRVPRYFVGLMRPGDPRDPLLAQVLPLALEDEVVPGYSVDPVGDLSALRQPGILHKYRGRALMLATGACAVHCRYCFRRHFPYAEQSGHRHWRGALETLADMPEVDELILSGGDPLSLSDPRLAELLAAAERIPALRRVRIHTRLPVVLPGRVTPRLAEMLAASRLRPVVVVHANHPNEVTNQLGNALKRLADGGAALLNQAVLLKSVNDSADTLVSLSESLFDIGVLPYYLHALDPVAGATHFDVTREDAKRLLAALRTRLPGYLVPRLVHEVPGQPYKLPV